MSRSGRPQGEDRRHFFATDQRYDEKRFWFKCSRCAAAYVEWEREQSGVRVAPAALIVPRSTAYRSHLKKCPYHRHDTSNESEQPSVPQPQVPRSQQPVRPDPNDTSRKRQKLLYDFYACVDKDAQAHFDRALLQLQADLALPDAFVERASVKRFLRVLNSPFELPSRKELGGRILKNEADECAKRDADVLRKKQGTTGARVNVLSDVWQNVARLHLLGVQLSLFGSLAEYQLLECDDRHDGVAVAQQLDAVIQAAIDKGWNVGGIVTDDAGQCARARRILTLRWPRIVFLRCFAHDVNNLVKAVLNAVFKEVTKKASAAVVALNGSSSVWLKRAQALQMATYGEKLCFIMLCETRWTSMQGCFASLLRVKSALEDLAHIYRNDSTFPASLKVFSNPEFWRSLTDAECIIQPLAFASFRLQRDENTMADVVRCYYKIYNGFVASHHMSELIPVLERRWAQCEQPLMLLTLGLHPQYVNMYRRLIGHDPEQFASTKFFGDCGIYYYRRLVDDNPGGLRGDLEDWLDGVFVDLIPSDFDQNVVPRFWQSARKQKPQSKLPVLAMTILSVAINTATCERYFSELALIHTSRRNRLSAEKARKTSIVRKHVRELNRSEDQTASKGKQREPENPQERIKLIDRDTLDDLLLGELASIGPSPEQVQALANSPQDDCEDAFEYWMSVLREYDSDREPSQNGAIANWDHEVTGGEYELDSIGNSDTAARGSRWSGSAYEPISLPDRRPFPASNDRNFPQEAKLVGMRGRKVSLAELFAELDLTAVAASQES